MHVPSYRPVATALLLVLASTSGIAQAVEFDEKLKAPLLSDPVALRSRAQAFSAKVADVQAASPQALITDRALSAERFDLTWQIQQAIDAHRPVGDLSAVGIQSHDDGTYHIDYNASPQWDQPGELLFAMLPTLDWQSFGAQLINRGFREEDVGKLKEYVSTHDARRTSLQQSLPLAVSFSKVVKKYDRIKRPVNDALVLSYLYQRTKLESEAIREWADSLLKVLDAQRARILLAYFSEMRSTGVWAASNQREGIDELLRRMRLPDFEQLATAEAGGATP